MTSKGVRRFERPRRFFRNRLSPEGALGLHLTIGLIVMVLCFWCFAEIADDLEPDDSMMVRDQQVTNWFQEQAAPQLILVAHIEKGVTHRKGHIEKGVRVQFLTRMS